MERFAKIIDGFKAALNTLLYDIDIKARPEAKHCERNVSMSITKHPDSHIMTAIYDIFDFLVFNDSQIPTEYDVLYCVSDLATFSFNNSVNRTCKS